MRSNLLFALSLTLVLSSQAAALTIDEVVTPESLQHNQSAIAVNVVAGKDDALRYKITYKSTSGLRSIFEHLAVRDGAQTIVESRSSRFSKGGESTIHFSISRRFVQSSTYTLSVGGAAKMNDGGLIAMPGSVNYQVQLSLFTPKGEKQGLAGRPSVFKEEEDRLGISEETLSNEGD